MSEDSDPIHSRRCRICGAGSTQRFCPSCGLDLASFEPPAPASPRTREWVQNTLPEYDARGHRPVAELRRVQELNDLSRNVPGDDLSGSIFHNPNVQNWIDDVRPGGDPNAPSPSSHLGADDSRPSDNQTGSRRLEQERVWWLSPPPRGQQGADASGPGDDQTANPRSEPNTTGVQAGVDDAKPGDDQTGNKPPKKSNKGGKKKK